MRHLLPVIAGVERAPQPKARGERIAKQLLDDRLALFEPSASLCGLRTGFEQDGVSARKVRKLLKE